MSAKKKKKSGNKKSSARDLSMLNKELNAFSESQHLSDEELIKDILYLLRASPESLKSPQKATETLVNAALPSVEISGEPEFEKVTGNPFRCKSIFSEVIESMDVNWESFEELPRPVADSIHTQILEQIIPRFFTTSLRFETIEGLKKYRLRKKRAGEKMDTAVAAALELILKNEENEALWPKIGLLQGIVQNSLNLADDFDATMMEALDEREIQEIKSLDLPQEEKQAAILNVIFSKVKDKPEVREGFVQLIIDGFEEGRKAILQGKLNLGLLTIDELNKVSEVIIKAIGPVGEDQLTDVEAFFAELDENKKTQLISALDIFTQETFTPEKLKQITRKLDAVEKEAEDIGQWMVFIMMLRNILIQENILEKQKTLLHEIIFGELASFKGNAPSS